ncbi:MAG: cyclase/dehydrase [Massilia sp.]|nr:cyclase/dehydrase [Massilia sp.]
MEPVLEPGSKPRVTSRPRACTAEVRPADVRSLPAAFAALPDRQLGKLSGWISLGFGLLQFGAPRAFARAVGMRYPPALIQAVGARDFVLGAGILLQPESAGWRWTRGVSDVMDVALVGAAAFAPLNRRRLGAFAAFAAAVVVYDLLAAQHRATLARTLFEGGGPG